MKAEEIRLLVELWRDVHEVAAPVPDEFNITSPTFQYSSQSSAVIYAHQWAGVRTP